MGKLEGRIPWGGVGLDGAVWWRREGKGGSKAMLSHKMPCCHLKSTPELPALIKFVTIVTIMPAIPPVLFCSQGSQNMTEARAESPGPPVFPRWEIFLSETGKMRLEELLWGRGAAASGLGTPEQGTLRPGDLGGSCTHT